jgi:hypothetical protein
MLGRVWKSTPRILGIHINKFNGFGRQSFQTQAYPRRWIFEKTSLSSYKHSISICYELVYRSEAMMMIGLSERLSHSKSLNGGGGGSLGHSCWQCGQSIPSFDYNHNLFCSFCDALQPPEKSINYFSLLNM